jgi:hypothetical protein
MNLQGAASQHESSIPKYRTIDRRIEDGWHVASGPLGILIILVLAALFGVAWSGISTFVALPTKDSETTLPVSLLTTSPCSSSPLR